METNNSISCKAPTISRLYFETKDGSILKVVLTPNSLTAAVITPSASGEILRTPDVIMTANLTKEAQNAR